MRIYLCMVAAAAMLLAAPALQQSKAFTQSDGRTFQGTLKGDEWFHWVDTTNGYSAKYNPVSRNYEYLQVFSEANVTRYELSGVRVPADVDGSAADAPRGIEKVPAASLRKLWNAAREARH